MLSYRKKVEEKRNEYIFRIQSKTRERQGRAQIRRQIMAALTDQVSNEAHFEEWKQHEAKLLKKYKVKNSKPDRLYQEYKEKNVFLQALHQAKVKSKEKLETTINPEPITREIQMPSRSASTGNIQFRSTKKV
jgi:hypothetical protein